MELFSGIGSQKTALNRSKLNAKVVYTSDWYAPSIITYDLLQYGDQNLKKIMKKNKDELIEFLKPYKLSMNGKNEITERGFKTTDFEVLARLSYAVKRTKNFGNISNVSGHDIKIPIDLLTYSFPCQDLSNVGAFHGYMFGIDQNRNTRSGLLWEVSRILGEMNSNGTKLPRFLLLENVASLNSKRHKQNFEKWKMTLRDLGYHNHVYLLNAKDFGIPQNRERLFMISTKIDDISVDPEKLNDFYEKNNLEKRKSYKKNLSQFLKLDYNNSMYLEEALSAQPNKTPSRDMIYENNVHLVSKDNKIRAYSSTLTTKQDRHPNSGVIHFHEGEAYGKNYFRFLTPREAFILMGFREKSFDRLQRLNFIVPSRKRNYLTRDMYYRLLGNSIVVNVLKEIFNQIDDISKLLGVQRHE